MSVRVSDRSRLTAASSDKGPSGLFIANHAGQEQLVFTDQEICDDIIATIPKLHAAVQRDTFGKRWKQKPRKEGVEFYEMSATGASEDPEDDLDIVHAVVAKTELKCHLNEVLSVLINLESDEYEATMKALNGKKFKRGDVLFQQKCMFAPTSPPKHKNGKPEALPEQQQGLIAVKMATLRPKHSITLKTKHKRTQKLCFSSFTHQYPSKDRAVHIMKTLPKQVHDQVVPVEDRSCLRRELDHLAVGYDIQSTHRSGGSINQTTRLFAYGYTSATMPASFGKVTAKHLHSMDSTDTARRREAIMNPEAKYVLNLLAESLVQFERVIRRRRFGFQSFIYFPKEYENPEVLKSCSICHKGFSFFRRDFFCQLCGHMCCNDCSQLYEVEARVGEIRKNRACLQCVFRVDSCTFDDEDLLPALGPIIVGIDDEEWFNDDLFHLDISYDDDDTLSVGSDSSDLDDLTDQLTSTDPAQRSFALETLSRIISPTSKQEYQFVDPEAAKKAEKVEKTAKKTSKKKVMQNVENHLSQSLRVMKDQYKANDFVVSDRERDYKYEYNSALTVNAHHPLPPMPAPEKEQRRLQYIQDSGVLGASYDGSALDLIAQVAAKRLNCPIGFVSVVDQDNFHAIGKYQLPEVAYTCPRNENMCIHTVYAEKPLIVKNPQRDMRFAQLSTVQDLGVKFYAGFPVHAPDGSVVASLCAADSVAHNNLTAKEYATMEALAKLASELVVPKSRGILA